MLVSNILNIFWSRPLCKKNLKICKAVCKKQLHFIYDSIIIQKKLHFFLHCLHMVSGPVYGQSRNIPLRPHSLFRITCCDGGAGKIDFLYHLIRLMSINKTRERYIITIVQKGRYDRGKFYLVTTTVYVHSIE